MSELKYASTSNLVSSVVCENASSISAASASSSNLGSIIRNSFDSLIIAKNPHGGGFGVHFDYWHID